MTTSVPPPRRKPGLSLVFLGVIAAGLLFGWLLRGEPAEGVAAEGQPAPLFTVEVIDGGLFDLESHLVTSNSRALVLNLWASWCLPCREEIPAISAFASDHPDITVIGVAVQDTESAARAFAADIGAGYPLAFGNDAFEDAYPGFGLPATYVIDAAGIVAAVHLGILDAHDLAEMTAGL